MFPALSALHSLEPRSREMYPTISSVTVPRRSEGIRPNGPRKRPSFGVILRINDGTQRIVVARMRLLRIYVTLVKMVE